VKDFSARRVRLGMRSRHRKRRMLRRIAVSFLLFCAVSLFAARFLPEYLRPLFRSSRASNSEWQTGNAREKLAFLAGQSRPKRQSVPKNRVYYPYSVIPGGLQDPDDLRLAAAGDRAIGQHYADFQWERAHLVRLNEPRMMFLSYRIGDKIFWTKKRVWLPRGEKLISDGKILARTRCGNRVEEKAQPATSAEEPAAEKFDQPMLVAGSSIHGPIPANFESSLRGPEGPMLIAEGPPPLGPMPGGVLFPIGPPIDVCSLKDPQNENEKKKCRQTPPPPPAIPEPGTFVLLASGVAGVLCRYRGSRRKA
jgi:hypothetical protein